MRNFNEGVDPLINTGLAGLPVANKLWVMRCDQQEADVDPTMAFSLLTQTGSTATFSKTSCTSASRIVALGAFTWTETTTTTTRSICVLTNNVGSSPKLVAIVNVTDGSAWSDVTQGVLVMDGISIRLAYQGET